MISQTVNRSQFSVKEYILLSIGSPESKNGWASIDQDIVKEKLSGFSRERGVNQITNPLHHTQQQMQEEMKMKKGNPIAWEIKSHIMAAGYTQKEAVDACSAEFGWSYSDSSFSNKLEKQTLRYKEALELAQVLGYEIVWRKRRDD